MTVANMVSLIFYVFSIVVGFDRGPIAGLLLFLNVITLHIVALEIFDGREIL